MANIKGFKKKKMLIGIAVLAVAASTTLLPGQMISDAFAAGCGDPKAILGDNNNLNFVCDSNTYTPGETYTDNIGSTNITNVWAVPENSTYSTDIPWADNNNIYTANFSESFKAFQPTSTAYWFFKDHYLSTITNPENIDTSQVTNMQSVFHYAGDTATEFSLDLSSWDVSKVTNMVTMFNSAGQNASTWDVNLSGWNATMVNGLGGFMNYAASVNTDADVNLNMEGVSFDTLTNVGGIFTSFGSKAHSLNLNLSNSAFPALTGIGGFLYGICNDTAAVECRIDISNMDISNVTYPSGGMGSINAQNVYLEAPNLKLNKAYNLNGFMSSFASSATGDVYVNLSGMETSSSLTSIGSGFSSMASNATGKVEINLANIDVSHVTDMGYAFAGVANNAHEVKIDFSGWDTSNTTSMGGMFSGFASKSDGLNLDLSGWDVSNLSYNSSPFQGAFNNVENFSLNLSGWDLSKSTWTSSSYLSGVCANTTTTCHIDLSGWKFNPSVTSLSAMFSGTASDMTGDLSFNLSNWDLSNITSVSTLFAGLGANTNSLSLDLSGWDTSNITDMSAMFVNSGITTLDFTDWDTSNVANMTDMFEGAAKLTKIYVGPGWNTDAVTASNDMFDGAVSLVGDAGTVYDEANPKDKTYAHMDGGEDDPGYFSARKNITISAGEGVEVVVERIFSPVGATKLGILNSGDQIYYGDVLKISFVVNDGYQIIKHAVNGVEFTSGDNFTVGFSDVAIEVEAEKVGGGTEVIPVPNTGFPQQTVGVAFSIGLGATVVVIIGFVVRKWLNSRAD